MSDIEKIRETREKEGYGDWDEWPYPTVTVESRVTGDLRARILQVLEHADDQAEVRLIETYVSGGYSEYTQEDECEIEVKIGDSSAWKDEYNYSTESAMAKFLNKFAPKASQ